MEERGHQPTPVQTFANHPLVSSCHVRPRKTNLHYGVVDHGIVPDTDIVFIGKATCLTCVTAIRLGDVGRFTHTSPTADPATHSPGVFTTQYLYESVAVFPIRLVGPLTSNSGLCPTNAYVGTSFRSSDGTWSALNFHSWPPTSIAGELLSPDTDPDSGDPLNGRPSKKNCRCEPVEFKPGPAGCCWTMLGSAGALLPANVGFCCITAAGGFDTSWLTDWKSRVW